jgi:uncharacterized protein (TIGR03435 family)
LELKDMRVGVPFASFEIRPDGLSVIRYPLEGLITAAYGTSRLEKLPSWARTENFDVRAKAPGLASRAEILTMLRALLSDRFKLKTHREGRVTDVYFLTRVGSELRRGLYPIDIDCNSNTLNPGSKPGAFAPDARPKCGISLRKLRGYATTQHAAVTMAGFASSLSGALGRPVIDRTALPGRFDIELTHQDEAAFALTNGSERARIAAEAAAPPIRDALKEQLGLTVTPGRESVDFLVVDSIDRPTPD